MTLKDQIWEALSNAVDNGYPHDYYRPAFEYVQEIDEQSGIEGYISERDQTLAVIAVIDWRFHCREEVTQ